MKKIFLQDWGPFHQDTLVVVGMNNAEIVKWLRTYANAKGVQKAIEDFEQGGRPNPNDEAFIYHFDGRTILWLGWNWTGGKEDVCNLVHETNHLLFEVTRNKGMRDECEAQAYLQEWLFDQIATKLGVKFTERGKTDDRRTSQRKPVRVHRLRPRKERAGA